MKYCSHCGTQIMDEAVVCPHCGCSVAQETTYTAKPADDGKETIRLIAKIFMVIGCVSGAACFLVPLAWCIPMTVIYWKACDEHRDVSTAFKVCSLLFVNLIAGILMLVDDQA